MHVTLCTKTTWPDWERSIITVSLHNGLLKRTSKGYVKSCITLRQKFIENDLTRHYFRFLRCIYIFYVRDSIGRNRFPIRSVVVIYEIIDYCAGASSAGDNAISLHGTSTPWHRSSRPEFTDPSLSLSLFLSSRFETRYNTYILSSLPPLSTYYLRHSSATLSATGSSNFNEFVSLGYRSKLGKSILSVPVWKESFIYSNNRFINRCCKITRCIND